MAKKKQSRTAKPHPTPAQITPVAARLPANKRSLKIEVVSSTLAYDGPLFKVYSDLVREPGRNEFQRDVIRHNGSVVILAVDDSASKTDPLIVMERQYRHAAGQYLWEVPAGKMDEGEQRLAAAKRELIEETGYRAKKWTKMARYFASPGFLGEWMQVFLAEGLTLGDAEPEEDEQIEIFLVPLSELLRKIDSGDILDGKTLISVLQYRRLLDKRKAAQRKKKR
jgi:ADP-ribose pyrophosphatase